MLNNQLKTAYRQLLRNRSYTIINIAGLAAGIAVVLLIFVFIRFENSYDDFRQQKNRIYRVLSGIIMSTGSSMGKLSRGLYLRRSGMISRSWRRRRGSIPALIRESS